MERAQDSFSSLGRKHAIGSEGRWRPNSPVSDVAGEDSMLYQRRRAWSVRRTSMPTPSGQQRWDQAYQLLLQ